MKGISEKSLESGLSDLGLSLSATQQQTCLEYMQLLAKWNQAYNLSAVREIEQMLPRHLLDSLSIVPYLAAENCIDVGSGAGLPGIPLAIAFPDRQFTLLDSNGKKTRFLFQAVNELGLKNVTVEQGRVEEKPVPPYFAGLVCRAFSTINAILGSCSHLLADNALVYAMKGRYPEAELQDLPPTFAVAACHRLQIPGLDGERHLIILQKN